MGWLPRFFDRKKSEDLQRSLHQLEEKNSTTVLQILVEETIMAVAQWLITFVNRTIQPKQTPQNTPIPEEPATDNQTAPLEELLSKFGGLVEQLYEREQGLAPLYHRISAIEASLTQNSDFEHYRQASSQAMAALENRLMQVESQIGQVDVPTIKASLQKSVDLEQQAQASTDSIAALEQRLIQLETVAKQMEPFVKKLDQATQDMQTLEHRISHLEKVLARFSVIPKLVEGNYRAIVSLQKRLDPSRNTSKNSLRSNAN